MNNSCSLESSVTPAESLTLIKDSQGMIKMGMPMSSDWWLPQEKKISKISQNIDEIER